MTIKLVVEKAERTQVSESDLAVGAYYKTQLGGFTHRRVEVYGDLDKFHFSTSQNDFATILPSHIVQLVHPCHADGTLIEPESAAVEKVRADSLQSGNTCIDSNGALRILTETIPDGRTAVGINKESLWHGYLHSDQMVTRITITEIHFRVGVK